ncbi:MAG: hypothetical protein KA191_05495 [Verrucomicrobia bacterium]|nr:hypothetical protein [Verrucomicrobiota bacterium]MDI9381794.1 hypothetical protein [Verrucomicrobiota bacterium]NMD21853.1 hypothetical protein [Verrucomicrobiota bacterium]HOA61642.1 hypothetical protein [Verrucomicrobiota bacterium]HOF47739.1 hypothetical protein [Verrucomicrobiota bacterium]
MSSVLSDLVRKGLEGQPPTQGGKERFTFRLPGGAVTSDDVWAAEDDDE